MKKSLLLLTAVASLPLAMSAQELREGYITWPESSKLAEYVQQWNGGQGTFTINGEAWEDQEFFTSRVKPRVRFDNPQTQVYPERLAYDLETKSGTDKRLCFWVPISDNQRNNVATNALPNGIFDQEAFSLWSYVDHYGNWTCPWGWTPGAFADVAHKNGVAVSGVASTPWGTISNEWATAYNAMANVTPEEVGKMLYYFGQDGLGYNSEFNGSSSTVSTLINLHEGLKAYMADRNPLWEVMWYAGTNDYGNINFDSGIANFQKLFNSASMFLNYNWNSTGTMQNAIATAKNLGRTPFHIYAGMNMQGGEPKFGDNYPIIKDYQYSIGLWGAHQVNMIWQDRQSKGSDPMVKQKNYNYMMEQLFTNGVRNPATKMEIKTNRAHRPSDDWAGYSSMMNARSALDQNLASDYFFTYFNLGNGQFINWRGDRKCDNQWYNIGVQDFMPTWRWWFAPEWMATDVAAGTTHLSAEFTWEDAYVGGSCLKVSGTAEKEYLHLFKTKMTGLGSKAVTVRYKLLRGSADVRLMLRSFNNPTKAPNLAALNNLVILKAEDAITAQDQSYKVGADGWITYTINLSATAGNGTNMPGGLGIIGLEFLNADDMELLIGEISILPKTNSATPDAPQIKSAKVLANLFTGVDGKLFWTMDNDAALKNGVPKYNSDVKTSIFKLYAQQENGEEQLVGLTSSWAGFIFRAKFDQSGAGRIRFGVSAVAADGRTESSISWSDYMEVPAYERVTNVYCNKNVIKPNEKFILGFEDATMPSATWTLSNAVTGTEVWSGNGKTVECPGLAEIGSYDLTVTYEDGSRAQVTKTYPRYIPITSTATGALPEIYSLAIDGNEVTSESADINIDLQDKPSETKKFSYTGRYADGKSSRGLSINEKWFGVRVGDLGMDGNKSFSIAFWVRLDQIPTGYSNFVTIEDRITGGWPFDNWGYFWSRVNENGGFTGNLIDGAWGGRSVGRGTEDSRWWYSYQEAKIDKGNWTHIVLVFEYNQDNYFRQHFYINGKKQKVTQWINGNKGTAESAFGGGNGDWWNLTLLRNKLWPTGNYPSDSWGEDTYEPEFTNTTSWPIAQDMWISFGGTSQNINAVQGSLDDFQIWYKAMDENDVQTAMNGLDKNSLPADVIGYWDFEQDADANKAFVGAAGANATVQAPKAYWYDIDSEGEGKNDRIARVPSFLSGCPFLTGEGYPIITKPTWKTRATAVGDGNGEEGSADVTFDRQNDYTVELTLENGHGSATATYPVVSVKKNTAIDGIAADNGEVKTYVISDALFLDFAEAGAYDVLVYNTSGMLQARKTLNAAAGQTATVALGTPGIYLVKVVKDGKELRTVKVVRK